MRKLEFSEAVDAYLSYTASSWQVFFLEDYFDSFRYGRDVLEFFHKEKVKRIKKRVYDGIMKKIEETESL